jgi:DAACS family dicarboxylate/amino acid:cation (Na+ or H+) symporter
MKNRSQYKIFLGLVLGIALGAVLNNYSHLKETQNLVKYVLEPIGQVFLRGLFLVVVPLVFSSLVVGVAHLGTIENVKNLGKKLGIFYLVTTVMAVLLGQFLVNVIKPGAGLARDVVESNKASFSGQVESLMEKSQTIGDSLWPGLVGAIVPKNIFAAFSGTEMLGIIFSALLFGLALTLIDKNKSAPVVAVLEGVSESMIKIVQMFMKLAPLAVAALIAGTVSKLGAQFLGLLVWFVAVVFLGYFLHFFGVYGLILKFGVGLNPLEFFRKAIPVFATSFSTSSSNATIPTTIRVLEEDFKAPSDVVRFGVPLGATVNMDGTALFEMVAAMFIAQVFGIEVSLAQQATLVLLVVTTSVGVAGIPGASIPLLMSAMAMVGIPPEGIAIILGVDRLLDMGRTVVNVTGDMVAILFVTRKKGKALAR